jgi:hypothetical protein
MDEAKATACRDRARRYAEMAGAAGTPELRRMYAELAEGWTFLATEIERTLPQEHNET